MYIVYSSITLRDHTGNLTTPDVCYAFICTLLIASQGGQSLVFSEYSQLMEYMNQMRSPLHQDLSAVLLVKIIVQIFLFHAKTNNQTKCKGMHAHHKFSKEVKEKQLAVY